MNEDMTFSQIDQEKIASQIADKAAAEALEKVNKAQQDLVERLTGGKKPKYSWEEQGKRGPDSYDQLFEEVEKRVPKITPEDIDARLEKKLQEKEEADRRREEEERKRQAQTIEEKRKSFDSEWYSLVQEGKMPAPAKEIQERINKGERLTREEIEADEGLRARLELAQVAQNKSAKLAYYEDYGKQSAGAFAPVLGGRPSTPQVESQEYDYEDTVKSRKKLYGY